MKSKEKYQDKAKEKEIEKEGNANKINFKPDNNNKNSFFTEPLPPYNESNVSKKGPNYKICSLSMIKSKNEGSSQGEQPKKGIKLLGYNPSFPRKVEEWIVFNNNAFIYFKTITYHINQTIKSPNQLQP